MNVSWVAAAMTGVAAWGQPTPFERFCEEPRRVQAPVVEALQKQENRYAERLSIERSIERAKGESATQRAARLRELRLDAETAKLFAAHNWKTFDREASPLVLGWMRAASRPITDGERYVALYEVRKELLNRSGASHGKKHAANAKEQTPAEGWTDAQYAEAAAQRAEGAIAAAYASAYGAIERTLVAASVYGVFKVGYGADDVTLTAHLRGNMERDGRMAVEKTRRAYEHAQLETSKLQAMLAEHKAESAKFRRPDWERDLTPPVKPGGLDDVFTAAFVKQASKLVKDRGQLADGSVVRCERGGVPWRQNETKISTTPRYIVEHNGRSYAVRLTCACESGGAFVYTPGMLVMELPGTRAMMRVQEEFMMVEIRTANTILTVRPSSASTVVKRTFPKIVDAPGEKRELEMVRRWLKTLEISDKPDPLDPELVGKVMAAVFDLDKM